MSIQWAGLSPEVLLPVSRSRPESLRAQIEGGLREAIRSGRLPAGERLPSSRELARSLGVSRGLIQECFGQLQSEGYLTAQLGSATRVAATAQAAARPRPAPVAPPRPRVADFMPAVPDVSSFPRSDWLWAMREACRTAPSAALDYGAGHGDAALRSVLAGYLSRVRAAVADPDLLVVSSGFGQGLNLVLAVLAEAGVSTVALEDPGYDETGRVAAGWAGVSVVPVPVDEEGLDVAALDRTGADAVVVTPAHQWPTGVVLSPARRHALVEWARRRGGWIVEDDYDAEFRYDRDPVGLVQGLAPDRVFAISTVSKSLSPSLRLGWVLCPADTVAAVAEHKLRADRGSPTLNQRALAALIESGRFDRHLRRMRAVYSGRRTALVEALAEHAPDMRLTGLAAGFHAIAHLPDGTAEQAVIERAAAADVGMYGMSPQRWDRNEAPPQLVLGFGNLTERAIRSGIQAAGPVLGGRVAPATT